MFLTNVQWSTPRSLLYSLAKFRARYIIGLVHSILYRTYDWGIGNDFHSLFYFLPWSGFESYSISHLCNTGRNSFFDCSILNYFKILSRYVLIEKTYQASWSISIDLDAQYVSSFTEVFLWKTPFKYSFMLSKKFYIISDQQCVNNIYSSEIP